MSSKMKMNALMLTALAMSEYSFMATGSGDEMKVFLSKGEWIDVPTVISTSRDFNSKDH